MDIYSILSSKPHNVHFLKRYYKFIVNCKFLDSDYTEVHHICPKAKDLFPEYADLKLNPWNSVRLTLRQHYIAHMILWKAYGKSQTQAFWFMSKRYKATNSRTYSTLKYEASLVWKGVVRGGVKNHSEATKLKMKNNHSRYWEGKSLTEDHKAKIKQIGPNNGMYGKHHTQESRTKMKFSKITRNYHTPWGVFTSVTELNDNPYNISGKSVFELCTSPRILTRASCMRLKFPQEWCNKSTVEIGFNCLIL